MTWSKSLIFLVAFEIVSSFLSFLSSTHLSKKDIVLCITYSVPLSSTSALTWSHLLLAILIKKYIDIDTWSLFMYSSHPRSPFTTMHSPSMRAKDWWLHRSPTSMALWYSFQFTSLLINALFCVVISLRIYHRFLAPFNPLLQYFCVPQTILLSWWKDRL